MSKFKIKYKYKENLRYMYINILVWLPENLEQLKILLGIIVKYLRLKTIHMDNIYFEILTIN